MKKKPLALASARGLTAAIVASACTLGMPATALATITSVEGVDYWYDGAAAESASTGIDVLAVTGDEDDLVYVDILQGEGESQRVVATHLTYRLGDLLDGTSGSDLVAVLAVNFSGFDQASAYRIKAYDTRSYTADTTPIFDGTMDVVYGQFGQDDTTCSPIAVRTLASDGSRDFAAHQTYNKDGQDWTLASAAPVDDPAGQGRTVYRYDLPATAAASVTGHVYYVDLAAQKADPIKTEERELARGGDGTSVQVPQVIEAGGKYYRTLLLQDSVTLRYPGTTDVTVMCKEVTSAWSDVADNYYSAKINYVDESGASLRISSQSDKAALIDSVPVFRATTYTPPTTIYTQVDGEVIAYDLATDASTQDPDLKDGVLQLAPLTDGKGVTTHNLVYRRKAEDDPSTWTIRLIDGLRGNNQNLLAQARCTWSKDGGYSWTLNGQPTTVDQLPFAVAEDLNNRTVTITPKEQVTIGDTSYDAGASMMHDFVHTFSVANMDIQQNLYYIQTSQNTALQPYQVTVNYVNVANNQVIQMRTATSSPDAREDLRIGDIPAQFVQDGVRWIRLGGQSDELYHSYFSTNRTYTVYYRNENDNINQQTVVTVVRTVNDGTVTTVVPGTTTTTTTTTTTATPAAPTAATTPAGTTGTATLTGTGGAAAATPAVPTTGLDQNGDGVRVISGDNGTAIVNNDGTDLTTQRIEEEANPLAAPTDDSEDAVDAADSATATPQQPQGIGGLIGILFALVFGGGLVTFLLLNNKKKSEDEDDENPTA